MTDVINGVPRELKPCPFCGGKAEIEQVGTPRKSTIYRCTDCSCSLETGETFNHGAGWNERALLATAQPVSAGENLIRFDFTNGDGRPDSKMMTHDEMRQRYSELLISNALSLGGGSTVSAGGVDEREVWAVPVLDGEKKTTFYTEQLPFVPGIGVKQLGEPVRMVEARLNPAPATADSDARGQVDPLEWSKKHGIEEY